MPDPSEEKKPSFVEIVAGKDVALGKEIVEKLRDEEIGIPVKSLTFESKSDVTVNRLPGEENFSVTKKTENPTNLLGVILPTGNQDEFVFFGIYETGGVFKANEDLKGEFDPNFSKEHIIGGNSFWEKLKEVYYKGFEITLSEDKDPTSFNEVFRASVEKARKEKELQRAKRAESRTELKEQLFG